MNFITLDYVDIALATTLVLINAGLSLGLSLGLERRFLIAALRMAVQLTLVGLVLKALFATATPLLTGLAALVMIGFAGYEVMARQERRYLGWWGYGLGTSAIMTAALLVTVFGLATQVRPDAWYDPSYAIPILGMILGNTMTGVAPALHALTQSAVRDRAAIEARLALGAPWREALRPTARDTLRTTLGALAAVQAGVWRLCDNRHRLRLDRLAPPRD